MNFSEKSSEQRQPDLSSIENKDVREKALQIFSKYKEIQHNNPEQHTGDWENAAASVTNLKAISGDSDVAKKLRKNFQKKYKARIMAFDMESGAFPEGFDFETGKSK